VWLASKAVQQRGSQSRFSDPRLIGQQHYLTFAGLGFVPTRGRLWHFARSVVILDLRTDLEF
jgi:hypothetical protein